MLNFLKKIPIIVWIILTIVLVVGGYWLRNDVSDWWEKRKQAQFAATIAAKDKLISDANKERDEERALRRESEAREQIGAQKSDMLEKLIAERGGKIAQDEKKLDEIAKKYQEDQALIDAAKRGEVSLNELCHKQCKESSEIGYNCRPNYCDQFK